MNKFFKTIASSMVMFAMVLSAFAAPVSIAAAADDFGSGFGFGTGFGFDSDFFNSGLTGSGASSESSSESSSSYTECSLTVSRHVITVGEGVTLNWVTSGFDSITVNGVAVSSDSGSTTISNILVNTSFVLSAVSESGSSCSQQVNVTCLPPEECKLEVTKSVDRSTAIPGDDITYTITVKNIGEEDCTGGVKIEDVIDSNLVYVDSTYTSNFSAGYEGTPVYTSVDRTLHFDGNELTPDESGTIVWTGTVASPTLCGDFEVLNQAQATAIELDNFQDWVYSSIVTTSIDNACVVVPSCDLLTASPVLITVGGTSTLAWETTNATQVFLDNGIGAVSVDGSISVSPLVNTIYRLTAIGADDTVANCEVTVQVSEGPVPICDLFTASPTLITLGGSSTLAWETTNATQVLINNGIGAVSVDGSISVSPLVNTVYLLTAIGVDGKTVECTVPVNVPVDSVPVCESFTATPSALPVGGGNVTLDWVVTAANTVTITPTVGSVALTGSQSVNVTGSVTYVLTATDSNGDTVTCPAPVAVADPAPFSCANNVNFSASETSIKQGQNVTLDWSTTNVDSVIITNINLPGLSGSEVVVPSDDITYVLTATQGSQSVDCPVSIAVSTGGGGGGSSSPRCELDISETQIKSGEEIILTWDTSRATEVTLTDDNGKVLFSTDDMLASEKVDYFDGSLKLRPTRNTEYTLLAERGSKDRECKVDVEMEDNVVVLQTRDQQPLVAGISLSQVPYTGFEAGPVLTFMFYILLVAWAFYITYLLVVRKGLITPDNFYLGASVESTEDEEVVNEMENIQEEIVTASTAFAPSNLPVAEPVIGYEAEEAVNVHEVGDAVVTALENKAHAQKTLLSSDAVRHLIGNTSTEAERNDSLDAVIKEAKKTYPLEDGWLVINESRMANLCEVCKTNVTASEDAPYIPAVVPEGSGSLAEAIVTGNVIAAYKMIGNRPMFALADAAADLDAVYRSRRGGETEVSDLLVAETKNISDDQIKNMIAALTGAIDGTYTDEASAVKMAIMKAVKEAG